MRRPAITPDGLQRIVERARAAGVHETTPFGAFAAKWQKVADGVEEVVAAVHSMFAGVCGKDDSVDVELYTSGEVSPSVVLASARPVAQIKWADDLAARLSGANDDPGEVAGLAWGTGILIDDHVLLTAGHLFSDFGSVKHPLRNGEPIDGKESATLFEARFDYQLDSGGNPRLFKTFPILGIQDWRENATVVDFAVLTLGDNDAGESPNAFGRATLSSATSFDLDSPVFCVQHWCSSTGGRCDKTGKPKRVAVGKLVSQPQGGWIDHLIDTRPGASGAPIFDAAGHVIALQINGACDAGTVAANNAVTIRRVAASSPPVRALLGP